MSNQNTSVNIFLAKVTSNYENDLIKEAVATTSTSKRLWLSGTRFVNSTDQTSDWRWLQIGENGTDVYDTEIGYSNWAPGDPSENERHDAIFFSGKDSDSSELGQWVTRISSNAEAFVCEYRCSFRVAM